jgi:hypothetical protein
MPIFYDANRDALGRVLHNTVTCAPYGSTINGGSREFPVAWPGAAPLDDYPYIPVNFVRLNDHYVISSDTITQNTNFVDTYLAPFVTDICLNAVLLTRNGPYGFCTWKQLNYHANNPDVKLDREAGVIRVDVPGPGGGSFEYFEGPVAGFSLPSYGIIKFLEQHGPDIVQIGTGEIDFSFPNDTIKFYDKDLTKQVNVSSAFSSGFNDVKEIFDPSKEENKTGNYFEYVVKKEIVLYRGNPEKRTLEKNEVARVKFGGAGIVDYIWFGESVYPDKSLTYTKESRVREDILYYEDWRTNTDDITTNYGVYWSKTHDDFLRAVDTSENSQQEVMAAAGLNSTFNRWPLMSLYNDTYDYLLPYSPVDESETGELYLGLRFGDTGVEIDYNAICYTELGSYIESWADSVLSLSATNAYECIPHYRVDKHASLQPFYSTYENYLSEVYGHSKGFSIVPEFRSSEYVESEVEDDDFGLFGSSLTLEDCVADGFFSFEKFQSELGDAADQKSVKITVSAVKKFIPYNGFYPIMRSMQIGTLLSKSYMDSIFHADFSTDPITLTDTVLARQTFLHNIMSPGIFFNTIKSGIGVGFPVFSGVNESAGTYSFPVFSYKDNVDLKRTQKYCLMTPPSYYLPFESLFDLKKHLKPFKNASIAGDVECAMVAPYTFATIKDVDPTVPPNLCVYDSTIATKNLFDRANHNFFAGIEDFFVDGGTMTHFLSKPESEFKSMVAGSIYYMDVVLKLRDCVICEGFYDLKNNGIKLRGSIFGAPMSMSSTLPQVVSGTEITDRVADLRDPAYAPFVPPYFYGPSVARISFDPLEADPDLAVGQAKKFSLDEILKFSHLRMLKHTNTGGVVQIGSNFYAYPGLDESINTFNGMYHEIDWIDLLGSTHSADLTSQTRADLQAFMSSVLMSGVMDISQSVDLFNKKSVYNYEVTKSLSNVFSEKTNSLKDKEFCWCVNTKFETPVLDFSMHGKNPNTNNVMPTPTGGIYDVNLSARRARGMWLDYGVLPRKNSGLILELRESFPHKDIRNQKILDFDNNVLNNAFTGTPAITFYSTSVRIYNPFTLADIYFTMWVFSTVSGSVTMDYVDGTFPVAKVAPQTFDVVAGVPLEITMKYTNPGPLSPAVTGDFKTWRVVLDADPNVFSESIKIEVENVVDPLLDCFVFSTTVAASSVNPLLPYVTSNTMDFFYNKYLTSFDNNGQVMPKFESLIDVCGFQVGEKNVGKVAQQKKIFEAVVVVPFVDVNGEREFFEIDQNMIDKQLKNLSDFGYAYKTIYDDIIEDTTITKLIKNMDKYIFPFQFDFLQNKDVKPMVMYVSEFSKVLQQQDLVDIWQNLLPENLKAVEIDKFEIEHDLEEYEFFGGESLPTDVQFLVFKVKQKGKHNYYEVKPDVDQVALSVAKNNTQISSMLSEEKHNYNWPYDYCSLVEYAKVDCSIKFDGK